MSDEERRIPISRCARPGRSFIPTNDKRATMRVLFLHVDYLEYEVKEKALRGVPGVPASPRHGWIKTALLCFIGGGLWCDEYPDGAASASVVPVRHFASQNH